MRRGNQRTLALALVLGAALAASCAPVGGGVDPTVSSGEDDFGAAIALSVSAEAIYLVDPETGRRRLVADGLRDFQAGYAAWASDHRRLAYGNGGIYVVDTALAEETLLIDGPAISMPAWSRDGKRMAYGDGLSLWITSADSEEPARLQLPETVAPIGMTWRPGDGIVFQGLALDCTTSLGCVSTEQSELFWIAPDGTGLRQITHVGHAENPKWSRDGSSILFVRRLGGKDGARSTELWQVNTDGTGLKQVLRLFDVVAADWSPDGQTLAVLRKGEEARTLQLWTGDADGSNLRPLGTAVPGTHATIDW
ncbi:MAG: PD40 domain-containing protein [Actinobacteria bacterium]|nr:PD40 domain-containing protein [Actinomycetota bacterium]